MSNKNFMIIEVDPDGDNYELHSNLEDARSSFEDRVNSSAIFADSIIYLVEVKEKRFGFGATGDMFGAEIINQHIFE